MSIILVFIKMAKTYFICSDVHDDVEALAKFTDYAQSERADRILIAGDLSLRPYSRKDLESLLVTKDVPAFLKAKRNHNSAVLKEMKGVLDKSGIAYNVVPGNYDGDFEDIFNEKNLHLKSEQIDGFKISGYGGADAYPQHIGLLVDLNEIIAFDPNELYSFLRKERPDVILSHDPPNQFCDNMFNGRNAGTMALTKFMAAFFPQLVISGHIHESGPGADNPQHNCGIATMGEEEQTVVLNPGNLGRFELLQFPSLETGMQFDYGTFIKVDLENNGKPAKVKQYAMQDLNRTVGRIRQIREHSF